FGTSLAAIFSICWATPAPATMPSASAGRMYARMSCLLRQLVHEPLEQIEAVLGAGAGFGVILDAEGGAVCQFNSAVRSVEQRHMRLADIGWQPLAPHGKTVVHAGDLDPPVGEPLDRVIGAAVPLEHL